MGPDEQAWFHSGVLLIDLASALLIVAYVVAALVSLVRSGALLRTAGSARNNGISQARLLVAEGAVLGLSLKLAAALLKTLEIHTWDQILMFAAIFALRTVLKQLFMWEKQQVQQDGSTSVT